MRLLLSETGSPAPGTDLDEAALRELYAVPADRSWLRVNFVASLDGAVTGADGRSGSINTPADFTVFSVLRQLADVVLVGAGTVRAEGYPALRDEDEDAPVLAVVSNRGELPPTVASMTSPPGSALLITCATADADNLSAARVALGNDNVVVVGNERVDLVAAREALQRKGLRSILSEGGPTLFASMLAAGIVDEVDLTWAPTLVGGSHGRITAGPDLDVPLTPMLLVEEDGTVLGRWRVSR
ncbi:dihydrofolate reductase family protein [Pedococcus sp. KACC 23699]|uniref:Dihydrofolate reductase family protein n=1 Tax=Pedococcus sp. KACC 23699 TaxID=3149228 RepID=A0AAU7JS80_9MICO